MKVFIDYISGDEFLSDSFPHEITMNDACIEAKAKYVTKGAETVMIATDEEEEDQEGETVVDIQDKFDLQEVQGFTKADFMTWARGYLGKVTQKLKDLGKDERVPEFKKGATQLVKLIAANFAEMQIFAGQRNDFEGAFCFAYQKNQEDEGPTFLFFKDGLKEQKF
uniref:TCTP domain-containing protein n=2 Tax=Choreotrichia TaxID=141411 RepID=A0A7S3I1B8_9SPIT|mmetsp:Transcript_24533/g.30594  ORF Transcript_24533/g.30594 Transcript_24533/m.30594 type:complete len:166 (+) Transcript_24533:112-609(+)|eukprot:CAMPEP_0170452026 /NCGR_PEP_ID=MMETSP0123-20130129/1072_1 /TAXON_ID=182087 /ORGANISM="Favella ehrenbergii, Strain Fehren 1" /LENGTH=165 /DNA_ID=CAMNT_0010713915 /DNA_START=75 /DNA_END=572 /DNA_ORIENTATION=+